jgi:putative NIF3 family GTP cyclohydrolase 1 type 2
MNTEELMQIALDMVDMTEIPGDSAIYVEGDTIKKVLFGVDMGVPELLLAHHLKYDCVVAHHPQGGRAFLYYYEVLKKHITQLVQAGIPEDAAVEAVTPMVENAKVTSQARNLYHAPSVAETLGMPYLNIHNPLDELGRRIMDETVQKAIDEESTVQDVVDALLKLEEFQNASTDITIPVGDPDKKAGKVVVAHGAGTNGGYSVAKTYFDHGIGTVIYIHINPAELKRLKEYGKGNLIISGHIASDMVGINPYLKELRKRGITVDELDKDPGL